MSRTIDERIVQMTFNNKDFEQNAKQTIKTLGKLKETSEDDINSLQKSFSGLNLNAVSKSFSALETVATGALLNIGRKIEEAGAKVFNFITQFNALKPSNLLAGWNKYDQIIAAEQKIMSSVEGKTNTKRLNEIFNGITNGQIDTSVKEINELKTALEEMGEDKLVAKLEKTYKTADEAKAALSEVWDTYEAGKPVHDLDSVIERIEKLRWYSDETSYSIDQMTNAIGDFTSSGVDLDTATEAIMGIANACGDAGISAEKSQSAFTGFARAIGSGYMSLHVWNMQLKTSGLTNSERFKQSMLDAGEAMGTLVRKGQELYVKNTNVRVGVDNLTESFSKYKWATKDVMMKALSTYSDTVDALYALTDDAKGLTAIDWSSSAFDEFNKAMKEQNQSFESLGLQDSYDTASEAIRALKAAYKDLGLEAPKSLKAFARAQEAISFKQVVEATRVAMSSKMSKTFELIFGNYDEAKQLWTQMSEDFYNWFIDGFNTVNDTLEEWKELWDDFDDPLKQLFTEDDQENVTQILAIYRAFAAVINELKGIFERMWAGIFDPITASNIFDFVDKIRTGLISIYDFITEDGTPFEGVISILKSGLYIVKLLVNYAKEFVSGFIKPVINLLAPIASEILDILDDIGFIIYKTVNPLIKDMSPFQKILSNIVDIIKPVVGILGSIVHYIHETTSAFRQTGEIKIFGNILDTITKISEFIKNLFNGSIPILKTLKGAFDNTFKYIGEVIKNLFTNLNDILANNDLSALGFGGLLAMIFKSVFSGRGDDEDEGILDWFNRVWSNLKKGIDNFSKNLAELPKIFENMLKPIKDTLKSVWTEEMTAAVKNIAIGMLAISFAVLILASIPGEDLGRALAAITLIGGLMAVLLKLIDSMNNKKMASFSNLFKSKKGIFGKLGSLANLMQTSNIAVSIVAIASSMVIIAGALKIVSSIPKENLWPSLLALLTMTAAVGAFVYGISKLQSSSYSLKNRNGVMASETGGALKGIGKSVEQIATGLLIMSTALKIVSTINSTALIWSVGALGAMLLATGVFITAVGKLDIGKKSHNPLKGLGKTFEQIALGMLIIAAALKITAGIDSASLVNSISAISVMLLEIYLLMAGLAKVEGGLKGGKSLKKIASSVLTLSIAIAVLGGALSILAAIPLQALKKGAGFLAIALGEIWVFCALMSTVGKGTGDLFAISSSLLIFSAALGVLALALAAIGAMSTDNLISAVKSIAILMGAIGLIAAIFSTSATLKGLLAFSLIFAAIGASVYLVCAGIAQLVPLLMLLTTQSKDVGTAIGETLVATFQTVLSIIPSLVIALVNTILDFVGLLLVGLAEKVPELLNGIFDILIMLVNGLAELCRNRGGELGNAIGNLVEALMEGFIKAIGGFIDGFIGTGGLIGGFLDNMFGDRSKGESLFGTVIATGGPAASDAGTELDNKMAEGIEENKQVVLDAADELGSESAEAMTASEEANEASQDTVLGYVNYLTSANAQGLVSNAFAGLGRIGIDALKVALGIQSPSKVMAEQGMFSVLGLVQGVYDNLNSVDEAGTDTANTLLSAISTAAANADSILEDDLNPVITPVLDMSNIENNAGQISSLLGNGSSYRAALSVSQNASEKEIQNGLGKQPISISVGFTINEAGKGLTEADFVKYGNQIANIVNEKLGGMI